MNDGSHSLGKRYGDTGSQIMSDERRRGAGLVIVAMERRLENRAEGIADGVGSLCIYSESGAVLFWVGVLAKETSIVAGFFINDTASNAFHRYARDPIYEIGSAVGLAEEFEGDVVEISGA